MSKNDFFVTKKIKNKSTEWFISNTSSFHPFSPDAASLCALEQWAKTRTQTIRMLFEWIPSSHHYYHRLAFGKSTHTHTLIVSHASSEWPRRWKKSLFSFRFIRTEKYAPRMGYRANGTAYGHMFWLTHTCTIRAYISLWAVGTLLCLCFRTFSCDFALAGGVIRILSSAQTHTHTHNKLDHFFQFGAATSECGPWRRIRGLCVCKSSKCILILSNIKRNEKIYMCKNSFHCVC